MYGSRAKYNPRFSQVLPSTDSDLILSFSICSSAECQRQDWPKHKSYCNRVTKTPGSEHREKTQTQTHDASKDIWDTDEPKERKTVKITWGGGDKTPKYHTTGINFDKAVNDLKAQNSAAKDMKAQSSASNDATVSQDTATPPRKCYLNQNEICYDVPELDVEAEKVEITVKANKIKNKLSLNTSWSGEQVFKFLASELQIPLHKLKLIHKGKKFDASNVTTCLVNKAVFQAIGERAEDEEGIDKRDIDVMIQQLNLERNQAIKALREDSNLLDAMIKIGSK